MPVQGPDATIFDPGISQHPPAGWASGTVIFQGAPVAETVLTADALSDEPISGHTDPVSAKKISQKALLDVADAIQYSSANPLIAAAAPLLILFGHLRLTTVEKQAAPLASHVANSIEEFERKIAEANVPEEDARIAKFVLCEIADDIIGNLPGPNRDTWEQHSMLSRFFHVGPSGTGFYEALNTILANPETHYDLLELMHACLSLGFEGQYRGLAREASNLERVRRDVYETLRYFKARADDDISPRWQGLSAMMPQPSRGCRFGPSPPPCPPLLAGAFFTLRILITNEGDAVGRRVARAQSVHTDRHRTRELRAVDRGSENHRPPRSTASAHHWRRTSKAAA